jgi:hypothetical protein
MVKHLIVLVGSLAASTVAFAGNRVTGQVSDVTAQPLRDATVLISGANGLEATTTTDPSGHYEATIPTAGPHTVIFVFGSTRVARKVTVPDNGTARLDTTLEAGGEIIEVHDRDRPLQYAKPKSDPRAVPRYSDAAALSDKWSKAWFLLDVDARGIVQRVKFLKRPGNDLDKIAVEHAFDLRFDPARDKHGYPAASYVLWALEWPALGWFQLLELPPTRMPMLDSFQTEGGTPFSAGVLFSTWPPCGAEGTGVPLDFADGDNDRHHAGLRDCSVPDLSRADATEPWVSRDPVTQPAPEVAAAPRLDPEQLRVDELAHVRNSKIAAIATTAASAAFVAATIYSAVQMSRASDRVDADTAPSETRLAPGQLEADRSSLRHWELGAVGLAAGAAVTGLVSAHFWKESQLNLSFQPNGEGATMSLGGQF